MTRLLIVLVSFFAVSSVMAQTGGVPPGPPTVDANVINTPLDVNVVNVPDNPLDLNTNYRVVSLVCRNDLPNSLCLEVDNPDDTVPKLIHTATVGVVVEDGMRGCRAVAQIQDANGSTVFRTLLQAYATPESPGLLSLTFTKPILIGPNDAVALQMTGLLDDPDSNSDCVANATFGVELL